MLKTIPWDVWLAAALAAVVILAALFEPTSAAFIVVYIFLCAYIVVKIISDELA